MKIHKNDTVIIIAGKDKGKKGKVLQAFPKDNLILVEGVNLRKKHQRSKKSGSKGQIVELPSPTSISNAKFFCEKCKKAVKIRYKVFEIEAKKAGGKKKKTKKRFCKSCEQEI